MKFDLNCDLGENEPRKTTAALLRYVTSANIACGGHAGDFETMRFAVRHAILRKVHVGAHPGLPDHKGFGRSEQVITPVELKTLLFQQVSALERLASAYGAKLHHIKLHGALYHMVERQAPLRRAYLDIVQQFWPNAIIFSIASGRVAQAAIKARLKSWEEGFLDRGYLDSARLIPRGQPGALLSLSEFASRISSLRQNETVENGLRIRARTWCIHSDSENAVAFARRARAAFEQ